MRLLRLHMSGPKPAITHPITFPAIYFSRGDRACMQNLQSEEKTTTFKLPQSTWGMRSYMKQEYTSSGAVRKTEVWEGLLWDDGKWKELRGYLGVWLKVKGLWAEAEARRLMGTSVWQNGIFSKVVKVHEVKCALRARLKYICFSGACVFVWVVVGGGEVNWSGGLGGARFMYKWVPSVLSLQQLKVTPDLGLEMLFDLKPRKQREFVNSPPTFEEMSLALCQMSVTHIWCYRGHRAQTLAV